MKNFLQDVYDERFGDEDEVFASDLFDEDEGDLLVFDGFADPDDPDKLVDPDSYDGPFHIERPRQRSRDQVDPSRRQLVDKLGLFAA